MSDDSLSIRSTTLVRQRFSEWAQMTLREAEEFAIAAGRRAPTGEEMVLALLFVGIHEEAFSQLLDHINLDRATLAEELALQMAAVTTEDTELEEMYRAYIRITLLVNPVDCLAMLSSLLISPFLADPSKDILERHGLCREVLVSGGRELAGEGGDEQDLPAIDGPPLGRLIPPSATERLVGRVKLVNRIRTRYVAGEDILLHGARGVGKGMVARAACASSGRPTVEIDLVALHDLPALEFVEGMARLEVWLKSHAAGLLLHDVDQAPEGLSALASGFPMIVTIEDSHKVPPIGHGRRFRRLAVPEPDAETAYRALLSWMGDGGRPAVSPDALPTAVNLADTYLRNPGALPGSAIELLRAARPLPQQSLIDARALEAAVSLVTGLPYAVVSESERARLNSLETRLGRRIIGQRQAIVATTKSIRRRAVALGNNCRPMGVFLFLGPTGVGKTELARALASEMFGSEAALIKFNMGDYQEKHEIAKFMGSPPGYVGSDEPGRLIKEIENHPDGGILLFDEIEKANQAVYNYLLSAYDDGQVTSNKGKTLSIAHFVCIMTSNLGSRAGEQAAKPVIGFGQGSVSNSKIEERLVGLRREAMTGHFSAEFLNRIDEVIHFGSLSGEEMDQILGLRLANFGADLARYRMSFVLGPHLREQMVATAMASGFGARDLINRVFPREVEDRITSALLDGHYRSGASYHLELDASGEPVLQFAQAHSA